MHSVKLSKLIFPDLQEYASVRPYDAHFVNDQTLCVHVDSTADELTDEEAAKYAERIKQNDYVLWVDDIVDPFLSTKSHHRKREHDLIIVARSTRSFIELIEMLGSPAFIYLDHYLDKWAPKSVGQEVMHYFDAYRMPGVPIPPMVPISSEDEHNVKLTSDWNRIILNETAIAREEPRRKFRNK